MKINVKMEDEFCIMGDKRIESNELDAKIHKHRSGRDFTADEIKNLKSAELSPEAKAKAKAKAKALAEAKTEAEAKVKKEAEAKAKTPTNYPVSNK